MIQCCYDDVVTSDVFSPSSPHQFFGLADGEQALFADSALFMLQEFLKDSICLFVRRANASAEELEVFL